MNQETRPKSLAFACVAVAFLTTACGNGDIEQMLGTWRYTDGSVTTTCPDESTSEPLRGTVRFEQGLHSDLVFYTDDGSCILNFAAGPDGARIEPGERCTGQGLSNGVTYDWSIAPTTWRFDISSDGTRINENAILTFMISVGGESVSCTIHSNGILQKISR
jgi:hypothetical protein